MQHPRVLWVDNTVVYHNFLVFTKKTSGYLSQYTLACNPHQ
jgi:hypothetical protein